MLSCVGFIEIELVFNINMQSVKARSQCIRQGLYQNIFGGLMANYLIFKNLLKEQNLKLFEKWVYYLDWWQDWWKLYLARKLIFIYIQRRAVKKKRRGCVYLKFYVISMCTFYNASMANNDICRVICLLWYVSIMILPQSVKKMF